MLNNDLINIKTIAIIAAIAFVVCIIIWRFNEQAKAIMGNFAALLVVFWDEVRDWYKS